MSIDPSNKTSTAPSGPGARAALDIFQGLILWRTWVLLGWQDIKQRYRRSVIGPFWLTISMGVMIVMMGVLFGKLFKIELEDYLPFLSLGLITWGLITGIVMDGCLVFVSAEGIIKQIKISHTTHVYQVIWRNFIIFFHNLAAFVVVAIYFKIWPGMALLMLIPGLLLIAVNSVWVAMLLGIICTRFRDIPQIVASIMQASFFMTPIIWKPELLAKRVVLLRGNPFYHFIELVRAPLLGNYPEMESWIIALGVTITGSLFTFFVFRRFRGRIAYWL